MKNKYYTPTIEEFHVGFEYEKEESMGPYKPYIVTLEVSEKLRTTNKLLLLNRVRVKYLDKEDIESFGFEWSSSDSKDSIYTTKDIVMNSHKFYYRIIHEEKTMMCEIQYMSLIPYLRPQTLFKGIIKNKSELKRILNQVNII